MTAVPNRVQNRNCIFAQIVNKQTDHVPNVKMIFLGQKSNFELAYSGCLCNKMALYAPETVIAISGHLNPKSCRYLHQTLRDKFSMPKHDFDIGNMISLLIDSLCKNAVRVLNPVWHSSHRSVRLII